MSRGADDLQKQDVYIEKRLTGLEPREAARAAGYAETTKIQQIEQPGGPVDRKLREAMLSRGIDEKFLAKEYEEGISASKVTNAREKDLNAHAQYLKQLGFLMGYGKRDPTVAVQINNQQGGGLPQINDPRRIGDLIEQVTILLEGIKNELGDRQSADLCQGGIGASDSEALAGVDSAITEAQKADSGGGEGPR